MIRRLRLSAVVMVLCLLAAIAVSEPPKDPAIEALVRNLGSPSSATINQSINELVKIGAPAIPCLLEAYDKPVNSAQRHRIVFTASYIESPEVTPLLARYLNDEDRRINDYYDAVRKAAAKTDWIGDPNDTIVRPPTLSPDVRALCIDKLGRAKETSIIPLFLKTLKAAPPAGSLIKDSEKAIRQKIARMLSRFTDTPKPDIELLTAIEELLTDKDKEVVRWAIYALGQSSCKAGIDKLVKLTANSDKALAEYAVSALGNLKEQSALEPIRKCAKDSNQFFRACAQAAVRDITAEQPAVTPTLTAQELPMAKLFAHPLRDYLKDSSRKSFGKFIDPANIRPEAESFGNSIHVGDDCGWFQDGTSVYAIADGIVRYVGHIPTVKEGERISWAWGGLVVIEHKISAKSPPKDDDIKYVCSLYGHLGRNINVQPGELVQKGQKIGAFGMAFSEENGNYEAYLHFGVYDGAYGAETGVYADWIRGYKRKDEAITEWLDPVKFLQGKAK